jgi:hypothetical protein
MTEDSEQKQCERCSFSFHINNFTADAADVGLKLGLIPTVLQEAGGRILDAQGNLIRIREFSHWAFRVEGIAGRSLTAELKTFLITLRENQDYLRTLLDGGAKMRIYYVVLSSSRSGGESFDVATIRLLSSLGISLDVEFFEE